MKSGVPEGDGRAWYISTLRSTLDKGASSTVIVKLALPVCPAEFVAEHVTILFPTGHPSYCQPSYAAKWLKPVFGSVQKTSTVPSTSSVAVGKTIERLVTPGTVVHSPVAIVDTWTDASETWTVISFGTETTGGVVSPVGAIIVNDSCTHMSYAGAQISKVQVPYIKLLVGEINPPWLYAGLPVEEPPL